jgi:hypothetical protein
MNEEETRPTEGYLKCSPEVLAEILAALEEQRIVKELVNSASGVLEGEENGTGI